MVQSIRWVLLHEFFDTVFYAPTCRLCWVPYTGHIDHKMLASGGLLEKHSKIMYFLGYGYVAASLLWLLLHVQLSIGLSALFAFTSLGRDDDFN